MKTINIKDYCDQEDNGHEVYVGSTYGEHVRGRSGLDDLCETEDCITIKFPKSTAIISSSFLEGLLENIVTKYGVEGFRKKVNIIANGFDIDYQLETMYSRFTQKEQKQTEMEHDKERSKKSVAVMLRLANVIIAVLTVPVSVLLWTVSLVTLPLLALPYWIATGDDAKWWMVPGYAFWEWLEQQIDYQKFNQDVKND